MLIGIAIEMPFALGEMLLGLEVTLNALNFKTDKIQAYFIRDWRTLQMVSYLPLLGDLIFLFREALQKTGVNIKPILLRLKGRQKSVNR